MTAELRERFLVVDGRYIQHKDIDTIGDDGVFLKDGRLIRREP